MPTTKESIQIELATYKPTEEERQVLRSALFRVITPSKFNNMIRYLLFLYAIMTSGTGCSFFGFICFFNW
jgi:hypothetical protein